MGILGTLAVLLIILTIVAIVALPVVTALLSLLAGSFLKSSRYEWLTPYLVTIPTFVATFTIIYMPLVFYALANGWPFPESLAEFFIVLIAGQILSGASGFAWVRRANPGK